MMGWRLRPIAIATLLGACAHSPRTTILTIDAVAPPATAIGAAYRGPPIAVPAVGLPAALDRVEFVSQSRAGEVMVDDFARWAAPLGLLAREALVRDLAARLPAGSVMPPGAVQGSGKVRTLGIDILSFDAHAPIATMEVSYRWLPDGTARQIVLTTNGGAVAPAAASQAFAALLGQLTDRIVRDLPGSPARP